MKTTTLPASSRYARKTRKNRPAVLTEGRDEVTFQYRVYCHVNEGEGGLWDRPQPAANVEAVVKGNLRQRNLMLWLE